MKRAFSLLEIIIVILVISIILSFAVSKYDSIFTSSNLTKLKSQFTLIQSGISNKKTKDVLLSKSTSLDSLDNATALVKNEKLFSYVIDFDIISTDETEKSKGKWLKVDSKNYTYFLNSDKKILFSFNGNSFSCKSPKEICEELQ